MPNVEQLFRRVGLEPRIVNGKPFARIGDFEFTHYNYYTVVHGKVPLNVAEELYSTIVGKTDIRADGDAGCRDPKTWVDRITPDGKQAVTKEESDKIRAALATGDGSATIYKAAMETGKYHLVESEEEFLSYPGFITTYHIDSELGVYLFIQALRKHNLI
jgi:hypothetical protein